MAHPFKHSDSELLVHEIVFGKKDPAAAVWFPESNVGLREVDPLRDRIVQYLGNGEQQLGLLDGLQQICSDSQPNTPGPSPPLAGRCEHNDRRGGQARILTDTLCQGQSHPSPASCNP